jgi:hypothetical protein
MLDFSELIMRFCIMLRLLDSAVSGPTSQFGVRVVYPKQHRGSASPIYQYNKSVGRF